MGAPATMLWGHVNRLRCRRRRHTSLCVPLSLTFAAARLAESSAVIQHQSHLLRQFEARAAQAEEALKAQEGGVAEARAQLDGGLRCMSLATCVGLQLSKLISLYRLSRLDPATNASHHLERRQSLQLLQPWRISRTKRNEWATVIETPKI